MTTKVKEFEFHFVECWNKSCSCVKKKPKKKNPKQKNKTKKTNFTSSIQ